MSSLVQVGTRASGDVACAAQPRESDGGRRTRASQHGQRQKQAQTRPQRPTQPAVEATEAAVHSPDHAGHVDSALVSALRNERERLALLKLEQVMLDFMQSPHDFVEVGGFGNAVVVAPSSAVIAGANVTSDRPQTNFQRCILHRLADRFAIVRENGTIRDGYIRLVKQPQSRVPSKLLLHQSDILAHSSAAGAGAATVNTNGAAVGDDSVPGAIVRSFGRLAVDKTRSAASNGSGNNGKRRTRKMKIMKRSSSGDSSRGSANDDTSSGKVARKAKQYADKEKAYAEARARIFNTTDSAGESSTSHNATGGEQPADNGLSSACAAAPVTPSEAHAVSTSNHANGPSLAALAADTDSPQQYVSQSHRAQQPQHRRRRQYGTDTPDNSSIRPASTGKATYRNRQQEVNDPDFRRGHAVVRPLHQSQQHIPSHGGAMYTAPGIPPNLHTQQPLASAQILPPPNAYSVTHQNHFLSHRAPMVPVARHGSNGAEPNGGSAAYRAANVPSSQYHGHTQSQALPQSTFRQVHTIPTGLNQPIAVAGHHLRNGTDQGAPSYTANQASHPKQPHSTMWEESANVSSLEDFPSLR